MRLYPIKTPKLFVKLYRNYLWRFPSDEKKLYLTFDDGPTPGVTEFVLDELKKYKAKATFFCVGKNIEQHPQLFLKIFSQGHTVANHTYNHLNGWKTSLENYISNVEATQDLIDKTLENEKSFSARLFRPPYGRIRRKQAKHLIKKGYKIIMWDVLSTDWDKSIRKEDTFTFVRDKTSAGSLLVFHDSFKAEKKLRYVLPKIMSHFSKEGYLFEKIV